MSAHSEKRLDLTSPAPPSAAVGSASSARAPEQRAETRKFLGVYFACCDAYSRIYANSSNTAYAGHCPRCSKRVNFTIGPGGSSSRFFTAR